MKKTIVLNNEQLFAEKNVTKFLKVLNFLARHPNDSFSLSEVAEETDLSKSTASLIVIQLEKEGYILIGKISNLWRIKFNTDNLAAIGYKIGINLNMLYSCGVIDYILQKWGVPKSIVLFGSVRKGEDGPDSDIDIAIEIPEKKDLSIISLESFNDKIADKLKKFELQFKRHFKFYFFNKNKIDNNLFINIANGIVLYGLLEVKA